MNLAFHNSEYGTLVLRLAMATPSGLATRKEFPNHHPSAFVLVDILTPSHILSSTMWIQPGDSFVSLEDDHQFLINSAIGIELPDGSVYPLKRITVETMDSLRNETPDFKLRGFPVYYLILEKRGTVTIELFPASDHEYRLVDIPDLPLPRYREFV